MVIVDFSSYLQGRRGREMGLLLILFWCSVNLAGCRGSIIHRYRSRFGGFNSRLSRGEFPLDTITGNSRKCLIERAFFRHQRVCGRKDRRNSRLNGKNRDFGLGAGITSAGRAWLRGVGCRFQQAGVAERRGPSVRHIAGARPGSGGRPRQHQSCRPNTSGRHGSAGS